ncbi:MAG: 3-oxoacyl-[acyl-carrier-protein] reductase [Oscillospiraceae bacterium]
MLNGKNVIVTGASRGIGKAIALEFAGSGANVAILYSGNSQRAEETAAEISQLGVTAKSYKCDVSSFEQTKQTVDTIISEFGGVDVLVNNAGITQDALVLSMSEQSFDDVINTNLKGAFNMIKHLYTHFMKKRSGCIINISSVSGLMGNAGQANYASAKAGLIGLTKTVAKELASRNITCNAIAPGFIKTEMTEKLGEKTTEKVIQQIPMKYMGEGIDIARMAVFLADEGGRYITGEVIKIDGGMCM